MFRSVIQKEIEKIVPKGTEFSARGGSASGWSVVASDRSEHGDYSSNVALVLATRLDSRQARQGKVGKNPQETAKELKAKLEKSLSKKCLVFGLYKK